MQKYIIKNCPAYSCNGVCCADYDLYCKDYNNCLLKQIVELCDENYGNENYELANEILNLLESEEAE